MKDGFKKKLALVMSIVMMCTTILGTNMLSFTSKAEDAISTESVEFKVSNIFNSDMVLQRDKDVKIFGIGGNIGGKVRVSFAGQTKTTEITSSEWSLYLDPMEANNMGQDLVIEYFDIGATEPTQTVTYTGVLVGELWFCNGQSNMEFHIWWLSSKYPEMGKYWEFDNLANIRLYTQREVEADTPQPYVEQILQEGDAGYADWASTWVTGRWVTPSDTNSREFGQASATAMGYAAHLQKMLGPDIPVGVIVSARGGSQIEMWLNQEAIAEAGSNYSWLDSRHYNGMVHQIRGMTVAGILWYQGCANETQRFTYDKQFQAYAKSYRKMFEDQNLPIIYFQLPQYNWQADGSYGQSMFRDFRQTQWDLMESISDSYAVCGIDLGDPTDIHPGDKYYFTERAANVAMKYVYGSKTASGLSPYPNGIYREGNQLRIDLKDAKSLTVDGEIKGFEGFNGSSWVTLTAKLDGKDVVITGDVSNITAVRYLYAPAFTTELAPTFANPAFIYNEYGLPMAPFRNIPVEVKAGAVKSIEVTTQPAKTEYYAGETFDASGMAVKVTYTDGSTDENFTRYEVVKSELSEGTTKVTLTYGGKKTTVPVTVNTLDTTGTLSTAGNMWLDLPDAVKNSKYTAVSATLKATPGVNMANWPAYRLGVGNHVGGAANGSDALYGFQLVYGLENNANISMVKLDWDGFTYGGQAIPQEQRVANRALEQIYTDEGMKVQIIRMKTMVFLKAYLEGQWQLIGRLPVPEAMQTAVFIDNWNFGMEMSDIQIAIGKQGTLDVFNGVNMTFADGADTNNDGAGDVGEYRYFPMDETTWVVETKLHDMSYRTVKRLMSVQNLSILYNNWNWWTQEMSGNWGSKFMSWDQAWVFAQETRLPLYVRFVRIGEELTCYVSCDGKTWTREFSRSGGEALWDDITVSTVEAAKFEDFKIYVGDEALKVINGDVNEDGVADIRDLVRMKKKAAFTSIYDALADLDLNKWNDAVDISALRKKFLQ